MSEAAHKRRHIVCISGTNRPENYTAYALAVVVEALEEAGERVTLFDSRDLELGFPGHPRTADAARLAGAVESAAGIVLASPEYHGGICAYTKLVIENLGFPSKLSGKPIALVGVAAGRIGAIKSLEQIKGICSHVGALVVPGAISIAGVRQVFDEQGNCIDEGSGKALRGAAASLTGFLDDFVCPRYQLESLVRQESQPWVTTV